MALLKRIIIAGGRDFAEEKHWKILCRAISDITRGIPAEDILIVSGGARGADTLGLRLAKQQWCNYAVYPAQWDKLQKRAGFVRNELMAQNADMLIAFWDGQSRGTKHMITTAKRLGLEVHVINY